VSRMATIDACVILVIFAPSASSNGPTTRRILSHSSVQTSTRFHDERGDVVRPREAALRVLGEFGWRDSRRWTSRTALRAVGTGFSRGRPGARTAPSGSPRLWLPPLGILSTRVQFRATVIETPTASGAARAAGLMTAVDRPRHSYRSVGARQLARNSSLRRGDAPYRPPIITRRPRSTGPRSGRVITSR